MQKFAKKFPKYGQKFSNFNAKHYVCLLETLILPYLPGILASAEIHLQSQMFHQGDISS